MIASRKSNCTRARTATHKHISVTYYTILSTITHATSKMASSLMQGVQNLLGGKHQPQQGGTQPQGLLSKIAGAAGAHSGQAHPAKDALKGVIFVHDAAQKRFIAKLPNNAGEGYLIYNLTPPAFAPTGLAGRTATTTGGTAGASSGVLPWNWASLCSINDYYVPESFRERGIACKLTDLCFEFGRSQGWVSADRLQPNARLPQCFCNRG